jgi:hypothetical protein
MTPELQDLLRTNPLQALTLLRDDLTISYWVKDTLQQLPRRDPVDLLYDLDLLLNLVEAILDHQQGRTPTPASRLHPVTTDHDEDLVPEPPSIPIDQCPAEIIIGGTLDRLLVQEFLTMIGQSGVSLGWERGTFAPSTEPELFQAMDAQHQLHFYNGFAPEGEFPLLESWLVQHQIGFTRLSTGTGAYQAERVQFRRGLQMPVKIAISPTGQDLIPRQPLCRVLQHLKEHDLEQAGYLLERTIGPTLAPLPPFRIANTIPSTSIHPTR